MLLSRVLLLLASALLSAAQSPTTSSAAPTHTIAVGADPFKFTPNEVNASVGDIIEFRFYPTNHSVARAEYLFPCIPYEVTGANKVGFWGGFKPIYIVGVDQLEYQIRINDTEPIFLLLRGSWSLHSQRHANRRYSHVSNATQTWEAQYESALNATQAFVPGEYFPLEGVPTTPPSVVLATSTGSSSPTTSTVNIKPTQTTVAGSPGKSSNLSTGTIAGIAVGAAAIAVLAAGLFYLYGRERTMKEILQNSQNKPGFSGGESYMSGATSAYVHLFAPYICRMIYTQLLTLRTYRYPFSGHKSPIVNEYLSQGRDQYSGAGLLGEQHIRSNPLDSEIHRSRSPPIDDRSREMQVQSLNMCSGGASSPYSPTSFERRHNYVNGAYRTPTPRAQLPEGEEKQTVRPRDSEHRADDSPATLRAANAVPQGTKITRVGVHEMPVPS
ncbi:hypothetical protein NA56DRAFT_708213 [Hyaloscypha hepaticicola]|uniref:Uncharacterized protein n=1 Tax=Hyaloscypha hepaticicola TaxID=2082293 RepID=A0A2J6PST9_9HELO|nr:hypothetical protein NA56DRAFT_708213 [Hyaloscypha hepaticicola]